MIIEVDFSGEIPIYTQVRDQIVIGIASGQLHPGDALPSVRRLAADIGINVHTVNKAYANLRDEGFVIMDRRSGAEIATRTKADGPFVEQIKGRLCPYIAEAICRQMKLEEFQKIVASIYYRLEGTGGDIR